MRSKWKKQNIGNKAIVCITVTTIKERDGLCAKLNNYDIDLDKAIEQIFEVALNVGEVYKSFISYGSL